MAEDDEILRLYVQLPGEVKSQARVWLMGPAGRVQVSGPGRTHRVCESCFEPVLVAMDRCECGFPVFRDSEKAELKRAADKAAKGLLERFRR